MADYHSCLPNCLSSTAELSPLQLSTFTLNSYLCFGILCSTSIWVLRFSFSINANIKTRNHKVAKMNKLERKKGWIESDKELKKDHVQRLSRSPTVAAVQIFYQRFWGKAHPLTYEGCFFFHT